MAFGGTERPRPRWHHATTTLEHLAVVSVAADPELVRRQVHPDFALRTFDLGGRPAALVSIVAFLERDFAFRFAPFVRVSGALVDYRTYGEVAGERGVFVFRTSLDHPAVVIPRLLWRMPWRRERVQVDGSWDGEAPPRVHISSDGAEGLEAELVVDGSLEVPEGFGGADEVVEVLTHPMAGWYADARRLRRYTVWHEVLDVRTATVASLRAPVLGELGLMAGEPAVHSGLAVRSARFDVHTPPHRVRGR